MRQKEQKNRWPIGSVGHHLCKNVPTAKPTDTIMEVESFLLRHTHDFDTIGYVYVINGGRRLVGVISIKELFRSAKSTKLSDFMTRNLVTIHPDADQEKAALLALRHNIKAIPIVDKNHRFLGVIPSDRILHILNNKHVEDFLRTAGVHGFKDPTVSLLDAPTHVHILRRLPWLIIGLAGGVFAAFIVKSFEEALRAELVLAAFIPAIVYVAAAVGTQTETIFIRSLALDHTLKIRRYVIREFAIGTALASILSILIFAIVFFGWQSPTIAIILGISFFAAIVIASLIALLLPWLFFRWKKDPAYGSGPFATVIQDILSLLIYFSVAQTVIAAFTP